MLIPILLAVALIVLLFVLAVAGLPDAFTVVRTATFTAPAEAVFAQVADLRRWNDWSPWAKLDPNAKHSFEGPAAGPGAAMAWSGNNKVGEGRMTVLEAQANESIRFQLDFVKPFRANHTAEFAFRTVAAGTEVSWRMSGKNSFFFKLFGLVMDCETMVGRDFEKGFANLRGIVEKAG